MKIRITPAGAALFAGLIMNAGLGTPAGAICLPLWGTICRPDASPPAETADAKPQKPLNLRAVAHKGGKRIHVASRHRQATAAKYASRNAVTARARFAAARRLAAAKRRTTIEARRQDATSEAGSTPQQAPVVASSAPDAATSGTAPQTDGYVPSQNEVTALDLAADQPAPPVAQAPNPALWNAVTPTDPAANAGIDPTANAAADPSNTPVSVSPAPDQVASADNANTAEAAAPPTQQQPADEPSWLRRILIGAGGVLTLASVVRLFVG